MKATDVIKRDHRAAEELFERFKKANEDDRETVRKKIFKALNTHELMEDTHFYPAISDKLGDDESVSELEKEQTTLKMEVMAIQGLEFIAGDNDERFKKMMEDVLEHAKKEETLVLPKADEAFGEDFNEELGTKMEPDSAVANEE